MRFKGEWLRNLPTLNFVSDIELIRKTMTLFSLCTDVLMSNGIAAETTTTTTRAKVVLFASLLTQRSISCVEKLLVQDKECF